MATLSVLVLVAACTGDTRTPAQPATARPTSSQAPARTPSAPPADVLAALPEGPAPRIAYTDGYEYVRPDGTRAALPPGYGISGVVPYRDGFLVSDNRFFEGTVGLAVVDATGRRVEEHSSSGVPLPGTAGVGGGDPVWVTVIVSENLDPQPPPSVRRGSTVQVLDPTVQIGTFTVVGRLGERYVLSGFPRATITDLVHPPTPVPLVESVTAVSDAAGLIVGARLTGVRQSVVDPEVPERLWTAGRGVWLGPFSPGGRRLLATTGSEAAERLLVLDSRTGSVRAVVPMPPGLGLGELVWEDARHVLTVARSADDSTTAIVRIGLDGTVERTVPVVRQLPDVQGYVVPRRP